MLEVLVQPERTREYVRDAERARREEELAPSRRSLPVSRELERETMRRDKERLASIERILADFDKAPQRSLELLYGPEAPGGVLVSDDRVKHAFGRMGKRERAALLDGKAMLFRGRVIPRVRGGVVGMDFASFRNAPPGERGKAWDVNPDLFYRLTRRNEQIVAAPAKASGWDVASPLDFTLQKRGILHELFVDFQGTMTVTPGTGSFTQGWKWPLGAIGNRVALQSSGESGVQYGSPTDFLTRVQRLYRHPATGTLGGLGAGTSLGLIKDATGAGIGLLASGANTIKALLPVPVAHDMRTGIGSIFRPSDDLQLTVHFDQPNMGELIVLTGNATAVWSAVNVQMAETYMAAVKDDKGMYVLPDITRVFMTTVEEQGFTTNGTISAPIPRLPGILLCISQVLDQGNGTTIDPISLAQTRFVYGENQVPQRFIPDAVLERNRKNYDSALAGGKYIALDGEVDNPQRDVWIPRNFTEGAIENDIPVSVSPAATSKQHLFFENLVQANIT